MWTSKLSERWIEVGRKFHEQRLKGENTYPIGNTEVAENSWSFKVEEVIDLWREDCLAFLKARNQPLGAELESECTEQCPFTTSRSPAKLIAAPRAKL